jgi:hypothetical protein
MQEKFTLNYGTKWCWKIYLIIAGNENHTVTDGETLEGEDISELV